MFLPYSKRLLWIRSSCSHFSVSVAPERERPMASIIPPGSNPPRNCQIRIRDCRTTVWCAANEPPLLPVLPVPNVHWPGVCRVNYSMLQWGVFSVIRNISKILVNPGKYSYKSIEQKPSLVYVNWDFLLCMGILLYSEPLHRDPHWQRIPYHLQ